MLAIFMTGIINVQAQDNVYFSPGLGVGFFQDTVMIYGKLTVNGGNLVFNPNARVYFFGDSMHIVTGSTVTGAGQLIFKGPRLMGSGGNFPQYLDAGGTQLGSVVIDNSKNLQIINSSAGALDTLRFINGKMYLNGNDFVVGASGPGVIDGFDENRYVVTNSPLQINQGFLVRKNVGAVKVVWPIGPNDLNYEPAAMSNTGTPDNFSIRVAPEVKELAVSGSQQNDRSTQTTWFVKEAVVGGSNANLYLQHNTGHEGAHFTNYRPYHFISRYVGFSPNTEGDTISYTNWDNFAKASTQAGTSPGDLTTGTPVSSTIVSVRNNLKYFGAFAKTVWNDPWMVVPLPIEFLGINATWKSDQIATVSWTVDNDEQVATYLVERALPGDKKFSYLTTVTAKKENGIVKYSTDDDLSAVTGTILYRITATGTNGKTYTSGVASLFKQGSNAGIMMAPNPTSSFVDITTFGNNLTEEALEVNVYSQTGALVYKNTDPTGQTIRIQTQTWAEGVYIVQIRHGAQIQTQKLMVVKN